MVPDPAVRARRIEMDRRALIRGHERLAEKAGAKVRHDHRHLRSGEGRSRKGERIAQAKVEAAWKAELLAHANAQRAAVREYHRAMRGGHPKHGLDGGIVE